MNELVNGKIIIRLSIKGISVHCLLCFRTPCDCWSSSHLINTFWCFDSCRRCGSSGKHPRAWSGIGEKHVGLRNAGAERCAWRKIAARQSGATRQLPIHSPPPPIRSDDKRKRHFELHVEKANSRGGRCVWSMKMYWHRCAAPTEWESIRDSLMPFPKNKHLQFFLQMRSISRDFPFLQCWNISCLVCDDLRFRSRRFSWELRVGGRKLQFN